MCSLSADSTHVEMSEDLEIRTLAYLSKCDYLTCKLVCKRWDSLRHKVGVMRKQISNWPKTYRITSKRNPSMSWTAINHNTIKLSDQCGEINTARFELVPGLYKEGDETSANSFNQQRYKSSKKTLVSFRNVADGRYLRHCYSNLRNHPKENSSLYRLDATFYMTKNEFPFCGTDGEDYYTFHSINYFGYYISHDESFVLAIRKHDSSDDYKNAASFGLCQVFG